MRGSGSSMCVNSTPIEEQYVSFRWLTISRSVARSGRPAMPAVEKVLSRSASLRPKCESSSSGRRERRRLEGVEVGEQVAADAVRVDEVRDAALQLGRRDDGFANGLAIRDRRRRSTDHGRHYGRGGGGGPVAVAVRSAVAVGVWGPPVLRGSQGTPGRGGRGVGPLEKAAPALFYGLWALKPACVKLLDVPRVDAELVEHVSPLLRR